METLTIEKKDDYAIVQLDRGKVNAINHQMIKELTTVFNELETDPSVKGVILSGKPHYFSAGLDVIGLYDLNEKEIKEFFKDFGKMYLTLVRFSKPFVCAVTGFAPAGGCVLAITADYRIMAEGEKYVIGLNEIAVNIQISNNLISAYSFWLGDGLANRYLLEGKLLKVDEALSSGLVDEVCSLEEIIARAETILKKYLSADEDIFKNTKYKIRQAWLERLEDDPEVDLKQAMELWWKPEIRTKMKALVDSLQKR